MTLHPRSDWTSVPAANARRLDPARVEGTVVHWNGPAVPRSALTDPRSFLEGVRRYHVYTKGWSDIAYNYAVDQQGDIWVLRGMNHQSAANGNEDLNERFVAVLGIIGQGQEPSEAMLAGIRRVIAMQRERYAGRKIKTHQDVRPDGTDCPGPDLIAAVRSGALDPSKEDEVTEADKKDIAKEVVSLLLGDRAAGLRNQIRIALDEELGDESGAGAFSDRVAEKVAARVSAATVDPVALGAALAAQLAVRLKD